MISSFSPDGVNIGSSGGGVAVSVGKNSTSFNTGEESEVNVSTGAGIKYGYTENKDKDPLLGLTNKKILMLGDSIMGNDRVDGVPDFVAKFTGATVYNGGFGGACLARRTINSNAVCFDSPNVIDALIKGDFSTQLEVSNNLIVASDYKNYLAFPETCEMLEGLDMNSIDLVTLAYGTNDWRRAHTQEYILSELEYVIDRLQINFPLTKILVITPIYRYFGDKESDGDSDTRTSYSGTNIGYTLKQLTLDIEQKAKDKRVACLNAYQNMQLSRNNAETYFDEGDKTHINTKGNEMYGHLIAGKIFDMFGCIYSGTDNRGNPNYGGNASALPTVTEEDNGKILTVQGGKWTAQEDEDCRPLSNLEIEKLLNNFT